MRLALISDLHGNELALRSVLADVDRHGADRLVCLGDTATLGAHPREVLALLQDRRCDCILGNHDAFLLEPDLVKGYSEAPVIAEAVDWCRDQLSASELRFVRGFVPSVELVVGDDRLLLFHGTPRSHMEDLLCTTPPDRVDEMLDGQRALVLAGGHTHVQMLRQHRGMWLVNPGSVGMPFELYVSGKVPTLLPHAEWALVDLARGHARVTLQRVPLERAALRAEVSGSKSPLAPWLAAQYA
jgi:predicted phosphodiesterase